MKKFITIISLALIISAGFSSRAANPLDALGSVVGSLTSSDKFDLASITGKWGYESPAISFKGGNAVNKIGGAAAAATLEKKLEPYYKTLGLTAMTVTIEEGTDSAYTFTMNLGNVPLKGTLTKDNDAGMLTFNINALGKIKLGAISAKAETNATGELSLTFDATRFMQIVSKVAGATNNAAAKSIDKLLSGYDGLYIGAKMSREGGAKGAAGAVGNLLDGLKNAGSGK